MLRGALLALCACPLVAKGDLTLHGQAGTGGVGLGVSGTVSESLSWRIEANGMDLTGSRTAEGVDFDYEARFRDLGFLVDWHVSGWVTLSAGAVAMRETRFYATATGGILYGINLADFNPQPGDLDATVTFKSWAPYLGLTLGDRRPGAGQMAFFAEIGLSRSQPRFTFSEPYHPLLIPALVEAKEIEINRGMPAQDGWWPMVKVGFGYGF
jgi:hypothetical protein